MATNNTTISIDPVEDMRRPDFFIVVVTLLIPSLICSVYLFIQFATNHTLRRQIHNHITLILLVVNFLQATTDIPFMLLLLHHGEVYQSYFFCQLWIFADYVLNVVILMLVCYGSIERYLMVFYHHLYIIHVYLLHYIPIGFCFIYPIAFYVIVLFFYPCTTVFQYDMYTCGGPCYVFDARVSAFDQLAHIFTPVVITTAASTILLWRIIRQKQRLKLQNTWKKNRRLTLQILSVCFLHTAAWGPIVTVMLIVLFSTVPQPVLVNILINWVPFSYFVVILLYPFVCLIGLTEVWLNMTKSLKRRFRLIKNTVGLE